MNLAQIIDVVRQQYINDVVEPYRYSNTYLVSLANLAEEEACHRSQLILEKTNATANDIATGYATSATSATITKLVDSGAVFSSTVLNKTVYNTTDDTFATVLAVDSTTKLSLSVDIMGAGENYIIGDSTKALTRVCVTSGVISYNLSDKITEIESCYLASVKTPLWRKTTGWLDKFYYKWRDAEGIPKYFYEDNNKIYLVPKPNGDLNDNTGKDTLILSVYRLPLTSLSLTLNNTPGIPSSYHLALTHGICMYLYGDKLGANAGNIIAYHEKEFEKVFGKPVSANIRQIRRILPPLITMANAKW